MAQKLNSFKSLGKHYMLLPSFQLPRVIEGGVGVNDSREFEFYPGVALAARGGWALHRGQVV